jgi:hypothetical protein
VWLERVREWLEQGRERLANASGQRVALAMTLAVLAALFVVGNVRARAWWWVAFFAVLLAVGIAILVTIAWSKLRRR